MKKRCLGHHVPHAAAARTRTGPHGQAGSDTPKASTSPRPKRSHTPAYIA